MTLTLESRDSSRHILVACHAWYHDTFGGSFRLASEFAEHLAADGHRVSYLCSAASSDAAPQETVNGVTVYRYSAPGRRLGRLRKLLYHVRESRRLAMQIHRSCAVNSVSGHSPLQGLGAAEALKPRSAYINYTVHSPFDQELLSNIGNSAPSMAQRLASRIAGWIEVRNIHLADVIQTDSVFTQTCLREMSGKIMSSRGVVAPGWVDTGKFQASGMDRCAVRNCLGDVWQTELPILFTLRRLEQRMGLDTFIDACALLRENGLQFRTLIAGSGSLKQALLQQIQSAGLADCVYLVGRMPEEQLSTAYAAADCFVLPTRSLECFGLIVLEAFACGTPVIASATSAIPEIAARQGDEWMFEPGNSQQLAEKLQAFLNGSLNVTTDLRGVALEFEKQKVLSRWSALTVR